MRFNQIYALSLRHVYLICNSLPRIIDLIYWPAVQIFLWGFISKFFTLNSSAQALAFSKLNDAMDCTSTPSICLNAGKYAALAKLQSTSVSGRLEKLKYHV